MLLNKFIFPQLLRDLSLKVWKILWETVKMFMFQLLGNKYLKTSRNLLVYLLAKINQPLKNTMDHKLMDSKWMKTLKTSILDRVKNWIYKMFTSQIFKNLRKIYSKCWEEMPIIGTQRMQNIQFLETMIKQDGKSITNGIDSNKVRKNGNSKMETLGGKTNKLHLKRSYQFWLNNSLL